MLTQGLASSHLKLSSSKKALRIPLAAPKEQVYLGFDKTDTAPRTGRTGRIIQDDPNKYPKKENLGFFIGATGGWAGGEATIAKLKEEAQAFQPKKTSQPQARKVVDSPAPKSTSGKDLQYIGFRKDELDLRKSGARGRVIIDKPEKYPAKDTIGPLLGITGGFAGGEAGLQQFVEKGEVKFRKPGDPGKKQSSPLTLAGLLVFFGAGGGIGLSVLINAASVSESIQVFDSKTTSLLISVVLGAISLLAGGAFLSSSKAARPQVKQ